MGGDTKDAAKTLLPEAEIYLNLLALVYLHDQKQYDKVCLSWAQEWHLSDPMELTRSRMYKQGVTLATATVEAIQNFHRRTLDPIAGRVYFYYARFYELLGKLADIRP
jgi:26S proteasome regulatory subunit N3